jgi:hypothetical protein
MTVWHVHIDRIRVLGAATTGLQPDGVREQVARAVRDAFKVVPLPEARTARASVRVIAGPIKNAAAIATAVANGTATAAGGRARG